VELHPKSIDFVQYNVLLSLDVLVELMGRMLNPLNANINIYFV